MWDMCVIVVGMNFQRTPKGVWSEMTHRPVITIKLQPRQGFSKEIAEKYIREKLELMPTDKISFHFEQEGRVKMGEIETAMDLFNEEVEAGELCPKCLQRRGEVVCIEVLYKGGKCELKNPQPKGDGV